MLRLQYRGATTIPVEAECLTPDFLAGKSAPEIARLPVERTAGSLAVTLRVPLDSTYLFDRGPEGRYLGPPGAPAPASGAQETPLAPYAPG